MPDDATTTETAAEPTDGTAVETPPYVFPFDIPADLGVVSDDDLRALHAQVREHAATLGALPPNETSDDTVTALRACRDLAVDIAGVFTARRDRTDEAASLAAEIDELALGDDDDPAEPGDPTPPEPAGPATADPSAGALAIAPAARRPAPRVRDVARSARAPQLPADARRGVYATMTAATDVAGFVGGQRLEKFSDAAKALSARLNLYPAVSQTRPGGKFRGERRPVTAYEDGDPGRRFELRTYNRHQVIEFRRDFPDELRVTDDNNGYRVAEYAAGERRLPGGNLIESAKRAVASGRSLTAAAGWCAPSETIYDLCELETLDGILDAPELQTTRGGWQIPTNGGPDFASVYNSIGNSGDTHLTEAEVIAEVPKVCTDIPCPPFEDIRLAVDYFCLTGGLLQRRGYPEVVARFGRAAVVALAHKINQGFIAAIIAGSTPATIIPPDPSGDDAASSLLSGVELAIVDAKYRHRMGFNSTMEVVLPWWVLVPIRAAMARRTGVAMMAVTDAQILSWFTERGAVPRFVYDWQDAFSGLATGPGGATPLAALPGTAQFLVYPAGTWVKAVQDVVSLDTVYDSTLLATNQFTAVFVEDGWAALKMCALSRLYTAFVDPSGVTGCCPTLVS